MRRPSRVDVAALLDRLRIEATRKGHALWAPCPLPSHKDADPSWSIVDAVGSPKHAMWWCFGCGSGGGPRALVREVLELGRCDCGPRRTCESCKKAIAWLKGAPVLEPSGDVPVVELVSPRGDPVLEIPPGVEFGPLAGWPSTFRRYVEGRGVTAEQVERWGLGYAVAGKLEMRLVIPIRDERGELLSYAARTLIGAEERYMTPYRRDGVRKGALFGRALWPPTEPDGRIPGTLLVCEGALDALAAERAAPGHAIAAVMGSNPDAAAVGRMSLFRRVIIASDGDKAGDKLFRELGGALSSRAEVVRADLPVGSDPASLSRDELSLALRGALERLSERSEERADPDRVPF